MGSVSTPLLDPARPQDADRQYRTAQEPVSIFRQPRHKYNPATIRPVEWPLPSMWSSQARSCPPVPSGLPGPMCPCF